MAIQLLFPENGVRFNLSVEDARRLLHSQVEKHILFINYDDSNESMAYHGFHSMIVVRYVIAFEGLDWCIIGDELLGLFYPFTHSRFRREITGQFNPKFNLSRVLSGMKQEYEND